jgi:hypothetical protein
MRFWRKTIVLAFAAYGAYRAWELVSSKLDMTRDGGRRAIDFDGPDERSRTGTV